ncbi:MAG TPA: hypothetical protein VMX55_06425 [candidate division Zixibacteria bacterium]|nr:hypothetical protein [candidate division Zixibacteria bacterium]
MGIFTPDQPWFYLLVYAAFMVFLLTFGVILALTQRKKKQKQLEEIKVSNKVT